MRRDITINSLFFNLTTNEVEDFTGNGLRDLKDCIIRTPLPPHETFVDDPLRVLRVIRFATRFGFKFAPEIIEAAKMVDIQEAFVKKISRERVGVEIDKMMKGNDAQRAISLICQYGFHPLVFQPPEDVNLDITEAIHVSHSLKDLLDNHSISWLEELSVLNRGYLYLASAISVYRKHSFKKKNKPHSFVSHIILHSLKLSNADTDMISSLLSNVDLITNIVKNASNSSRLEIGCVVRTLGQKPLGKDWPLAILISLCIEICSNQSQKSKLIQTYTLFMKIVDGFGLHHAYDLKPILNGKLICSILGVKPGPKIGEYTENLVKWQIINPYAGEDEAKAWVLDQYIN
jgi:tRNA nucleotidyltransferase (CCA-adding enzyme)